MFKIFKGTGYYLNAWLRTITPAWLSPVVIQYDVANRRTLLTLPNGVSTEYEWGCCHYCHSWD